jgi:hypothetical protein
MLNMKNKKIPSVEKMYLTAVNSPFFRQAVIKEIITAAKQNNTRTLIAIEGVAVEVVNKVVAELLSLHYKVQYADEYFKQET